MTDALRASVDRLTETTTAAVAEVKAGLRAATDNIERLQAQAKRPGAAANDNAPGLPAAAINPTALRAERAALAVFARTGDDTGLREIHASMQVGSDPDGGYLVTPARSAGFTKKLWDGVAMRRLSRVVAMESGSVWQEPIDFDEAADGGWVGEKTARPETDSPELKLLSISLDEIFCQPKITQKLLDDASFDVGSWLDGKIAERFIRAENAAFVSGNGVGKPRGLLSYDTSADDDDSRAWGTLQVVPSGAATAITADALRNLVYAVRAPHRQGASWLMSSSTMLVIDKLKDGNGSYLYRESMAAGLPPTLLGFPIAFEEEMPALEAGSKSIAFGNFSQAYTIIDRPGIKSVRDNLTDKPWVKFYQYRRVGGGLANSQAVKLMITQA